MKRPTSNPAPDNIAYKQLFDVRLPLALVPLAPVRAALLAEYPHAAGAIDLLLRSLREGQPLRLSPVVIVGPPGNGKSRLPRRMAELLGIGMTRFDATGATDAVGWSGTPRNWSQTSPSIPLRGVLEHRIANPFVLIDEIEKSSTSHHNGNLLSAITPFLEHETSARHRDVSLDTTVDLSWAGYISTANSEKALPDQIRDRFQLIKMPAATVAHLPALVKSILADQAKQDGIDPAWAETLEQDELDVIAKAWPRRKFSIRALQKMVSATLDARTAHAPRH